MNTVTISSRSRNIGYGWETSAINVYNNSGFSSLQIKTPHEIVRGGLRTIESEMALSRRLGCDMRHALFVAGRRIIAATGADGWRYDGVAEIVRALRQGESLNVTLEEIK